MLALAIVAEQDLAGLATRNLSRRVGITEGALFRHFATKRETVLAILEHVQRSLASELECIVRSDAAAAERVSDYLCVQVRYSTSHRGISLLLFAETAHLSDPELENRIESISKPFVRGWWPSSVLAFGGMSGVRASPPRMWPICTWASPPVLSMEMALHPQSGVAALCFRTHRLPLHLSPFGGMYLPYNLPTYYPTGSPDSAARREVQKPMMKMMYGEMFNYYIYYMMDKFVPFVDAGEWHTGAYDDVVHLRKVEPRWIPNDALLEISHAIRRKGALTCQNCHSPDGVLDWRALGYTEEEITSLTQNPPE